MSNNRMFIKCTCGEEAMLCKYYPSSGWYVYDPRVFPEGFSKRKDPVDKFDEFFEKHDKCNEDAHPLWGPMHYKITYEMEEGWEDE